jgi:hypothetical protein
MIRLIFWLSLAHTTRDLPRHGGQTSPEPHKWVWKLSKYVDYAYVQKFEKERANSESAAAETTAVNETPVNDTFVEEKPVENLWRRRLWTKIELLKTICYEK